MLPPVSDINFLAVVVSALAAMAIGMLWYSPALFAKPWMKAVGKKSEDLGGSNTGYAFSAMTALVTAYILAHIIDYTGSVTLLQGLVTGFWIWLAFVAPAIGVDIVYSARPRELFYINAGYHLAYLLVMGAILSVWV